MTTILDLRRRLYERQNQNTMLIVTFKPHHKSRKMTVKELREYLVDHYNANDESKIKYINM